MQPQPLSRDEAKALLAACPNTTNGIRDKALFTVLYRGGTRITATLNIRPADIDWERNLITIHRDKGGKGRTITIDDEAMNILRVWAERRSSLGVNGRHPFFCATNKKALGNALKSSHYRRTIKKLQRKAGIDKRCHLHALRHTAASELLEEGIDIATISRQLGHAHISTTSRYVHQLRPDLANQKLKARAW
jgi:site-specific recombinase XerD